MLTSSLVAGDGRVRGRYGERGCGGWRNEGGI